MKKSKILFQKLFFLACSFLLLTSLSAQDDISKLVQTLLKETPLEENLQELCDGIGGRVTGSAANQKSVEWAFTKFKEAGLSPWTEAFEMPVLWLPKSTQVSISGDASFIPQAVAKYQSPPGKHQGDLVYVGMGEAAGFKNAGKNIAGNFVLVETDLCLDINGLFAEYGAANKTEMLAEKYGAKGIVYMASRPRGLLYRFITSKVIDNKMPQLVMVREDAKRCIRILNNKKKLKINIEIDAEVGGEFTSHNVIAEIKGSEKPDEIILIGAHLDSWALGTGANDNGCNVSMMIDIARQIKKLGIQPKRTIRFALWNGEEQGYFGSWAYTQKHSSEMDKHIMTLSVDIGSGPIMGFFTNGWKKMHPIIDRQLHRVDSLGDFTNVDAIIIGTDNFDFILEGVFNLVANHKPALYGPNYHAASDTYDKVDLESLKNNSAIVAALTLGFANLNDHEITWKRQSRKEIQAMLEEYKMEYTMRMFNVWESWIERKRGRK